VGWCCLGYPDNRPLDKYTPLTCAPTPTPDKHSPRLSGGHLSRGERLSPSESRIYSGCPVHTQLWPTTLTLCNIPIISAIAILYHASRRCQRKHCMTSSLLCITWTEWRHVVWRVRCRWSRGDSCQQLPYIGVATDAVWRHCTWRGKSDVMLLCDVTQDVTAGSEAECCCWWWWRTARDFLSSSFSSLMARISFFSFMRRFWNQIFTYSDDVN